jgi:hypothetical protein
MGLHTTGDDPFREVTGVALELADAAVSSTAT